MNSFLPITMLAILIAALFTSGCNQDRCTRTEDYIEWQPVYKLLDEMRKPTTYVSAIDLKEPGKLFHYKGYLYVNEMHKGIHVIDNRNPEAPQNVGFIEIPGNLDMAINNDILYADSYLDLVSIDIRNPESPVEMNRVQDVFQSFYSFNDQLGYLVEYVPTTVTVTIDCESQNWGRIMWMEGDVLFASADAFSGTGRGVSGSSVSSSVATGGSMARFTIANDHLYTIDGAEIKVFNVEQSLPELKNEVTLQWGIETLFPMAGTLFVGSSSGLLIYDITDPEVPTYRSVFQHATACDPVVVSEDVAYVTLRDGTPCRGFVNQLDVVDVSNLNNPTLIRSYNMDNPHGLSVVDQTLYLCEGASGLKTFDVTDRNAINENLLDAIGGFFAYDVIVLPGDHVIVVGQDGLYQFDAADKNDLKQLSVVSIGN